jgi:hypothetical protein
MYTHSYIFFVKSAFTYSGKGCEIMKCFKEVQQIKACGSLEEDTTVFITLKCSVGGYIQWLLKKQENIYQHKCHCKLSLKI